ncbi:hypothetical protein [Kutzneria kofuensis]|uniref:Condensation domain-containing protein n=1 Tax=Kutzneria kofuensis TaxID=103725 RepID=A0A7W9KC56_9PSEU|nr:hypothetical protein [Kutzneria kofuensis]MBB5889903.1 hypothetical protein [Kutzneria kofuensis]
MTAPALRPQALAVRDIYSFLRDLGLDCDVNPCAAALGVLAAERAANLSVVEGFLRELGVTAALADLLDIPEPSVRITCAVHDTVLSGGPDDLAEVATAYHNAHPLRLDEAVHVAFWPHVDGGHLVFTKFNHMVVDLSDVVALLPQLRAYLRGEPVKRPGHRYRGHAAALARYADLPAADLDEVQRELGDLPTPGTPGVPTISRCSERWLEMRSGISFDDLLAAVTATALRVLGGGLVLQYPFSRWDFARIGGYFVEIRPLVVRGDRAGEYTAEHFARTRQRLEGLGRYTMSDLTTFATAFSRGRMPRLVVSDTTFMRPEPRHWTWVRVRSERAFEDLKFLADRSFPGPPLMRLQYKSRFLGDDAAQDILTELEQRIGVSRATA